MFDKIFGIFRKRKKADISQEITGDLGDELFDMGEAEFGDDFDADTISLETGMSDGGFSDSSGAVDSEPVLGDSAGGLGSEPPMEDEFGFGLGAEDEGPGISPPPEVEPILVPPKRKRRGKGILVTIIVVIIGLVGGFFLGTPSSIEIIKRFVSSEPTLLEQLEQLQVENAEINTKLTVYHNVGTIDEILADKAELKKRNEMSAEIEAVEKKVANRPTVEERLDNVSTRLRQTEREMFIQEGALANVQKALKQIEARNHYFVASTDKRLEQIEEARIKSEMLKARLEAERVTNAQTRAFLSRDTQEGVKQTAFEALSSL